MRISDWSSDVCSSDLKVGATVTLKSSCPVNGLPQTVELKKGDFAAFVDGLTVDRPGDVDIEILDEADILLARANPLRIVDQAERLHFWGDLHGQSEETIGTNSAHDYFTFARDKAFLDATGHQGTDRSEEQPSELKPL